jgi:hypothetical protein
MAHQRPRQSAERDATAHLGGGAEPSTTISFGSPRHRRSAISAATAGDTHSATTDALSAMRL